ncbi:type IV secretory system conjugative DNA transfer family protein [Paeniglutamicibacter sp. NPDC012692]|uniref:type IV secretory system conjugative DNA transfer family protein n=1 Tax=Paeniglutamicibacter sp. NPDC012692 TaxID=3364388 RepID=UPI0036935A99
MPGTRPRGTNAGPLLVLALVLAVPYAALNLGEAITPTGSAISWNARDLAAGLVRGRVAWPFASTFIALGLFVGLVLAAAVVMEGTKGLRSRENEPGPSPGTLRALSLRRAANHARKALRVPPGTKDRDLVVSMAATPNGRKSLYMQFEDSCWTYAPARAGKTLTIVAPGILGAPGPVLATSTKVDVLTHTAVPRLDVGRVSAFDLEQITGWPHQVVWDPVRGCQDEDEALARGKAWARATSKGNVKGGDWFADQAAAVLGRLLHAAALEGRDLRDVMRWAADFTDAEPVEILRRHGAPEPFVARLVDLRSSRAGEAVDGIKMTLQGLFEPLASGRVLAQLVPEGRAAFDAEAFLSGRNTVYVIADGDASPLAPLVTMFTDFVFRTAKRLSQQRAGGRLWPVFTMFLDEAPNVAAIRDMPAVLSESGGRGIRVLGFSQSFAQNEARWGTDAARAIQETANVVVLMPGLKREALKDYAAEMGTKHRQRRSRSTGRGGGSTTTSLEEVQVMKAEEIKHLRVGQALVVYRNLPPFVGRMHPLWERKDWKLLKEQSRQAERMCGKLPVDEEPGAEVRGHGRGRFIGRLGERFTFLRRGT